MHFNRRLVRLIISLVLGLPSYPIYALMRGFPFEQITGYAFTQYGITAALAFFGLFELQQLKAIKLDKILSWEGHLTKRLLIEIGTSLLITVAVVYTAYSTLYVIIWDMPVVLPSVILYVCLVFFISLCFMVFVNASKLFDQWRQSLVRIESLEKEAANARFAALRTQLSPHFFFNNLSILNGLIDGNSKEAKEFIHKFSQVFRYILQHENHEVVLLKEEIEFVKDYLYLLKSRFGDKLLYKIEVPETRDDYIPPVSIQVLLENAVKHNEMSIDAPLSIVVKKTDKSVQVVNNKKERKGKILSLKTGLEGLRQRFQILTEEPIKVQDTHAEFLVTIPIISVE